MQKEAEIASSADYINTDSVYSLLNQKILTMSDQVFRERRTIPRRKII